MKIFFSYANEDQQLAQKLADLLKLGAGLSYNQIFLSADGDSIPNGVYFVDHILDMLNSSTLVVALLSRKYLESQFCLEELGAALARQRAGLAEFHSLVIPPLRFSDLDGALVGRQSAQILDETALSGLRQSAIRGTNTPPCGQLWDQKEQEFLHFAKEDVAYRETEQLANLVTLQDLIIARNQSESYTVKLRIVLKNESGEVLKVAEAVWDPTKQGAPIQKRGTSLHWQLLEGQDTWSTESPSIQVPAGMTFRTWIGLSHKITDAEILTRCAIRRLGILSLKLAIKGHDTLRDIEL